MIECHPPGVLTKSDFERRYKFVPTAHFTMSEPANFQRDRLWKVSWI